MNDWLNDRGPLGYWLWSYFRILELIRRHFPPHERQDSNAVHRQVEGGGGAESAELQARLTAECEDGVSSQGRSHLFLLFMD